MNITFTTTTTLTDLLDDAVIVHLENGADEEQAKYQVLADVVTALYGDSAAAVEQAPGVYLVRTQKEKS
jgi:hypothetical protein